MPKLLVKKQSRRECLLLSILLNSLTVLVPTHFSQVGKNREEYKNRKRINSVKIGKTKKPVNICR